jgi:hypothetical protein
MCVDIRGDNKGYMYELWLREKKKEIKYPERSVFSSPSLPMKPDINQNTEES